jgi:hypothetical protein
MEGGRGEERRGGDKAGDRPSGRDDKCALCRHRRQRRVLCSLSLSLEDRRRAWGTRVHSATDVAFALGIWLPPSFSSCSAERKPTTWPRRSIHHLPRVASGAVRGKRGPARPGPTVGPSRAGRQSEKALGGLTCSSAAVYVVSGPFLDPFFRFAKVKRPPSISTKVYFSFLNSKTK